MTEIRRNEECCIMQPTCFMPKDIKLCLQFKLCSAVYSWMFPEQDISKIGIPQTVVQKEVIKAGFELGGTLERWEKLLNEVVYAT